MPSVRPRPLSFPVNLGYIFLSVMQALLDVATVENRRKRYIKTKKDAFTMQVLQDRPV